MKNKCIAKFINNELDIDKIYLYGKDSHEAKYQLPINRRESMGGKYFIELKSF